MSDDSLKMYIAWRAAKDLTYGVVNLGIGIPTLVADFIPKGLVTLHSENGILGVGPTPLEGEEDLDLVNAGKDYITSLPYSSYFDSSLSFAMMRGGHLDATIIGALQVAENGDIASWAIPGEDVLGVGGVMDLVIGAKKVIVTTKHLTQSGEPKILPCCTYPLTAKNRVDTIVTELAVFKFVDGCFQLTEKIEEISFEELKNITPAFYKIAPNVKSVSRTQILNDILYSSSKS
ncbi:3-oxoacid CoA-transferase subunit B [Rummeliibacillus sp. JY-2-4R]